MEWNGTGMKHYCIASVSYIWYSAPAGSGLPYYIHEVTLPFIVFTYSVFSALLTLLSIVLVLCLFGSLADSLPFSINSYSHMHVYSSSFCVCFACDEFTDKHTALPVMVIRPFHMCSSFPGTNEAIKILESSYLSQKSTFTM